LVSSFKQDVVVTEKKFRCNNNFYQITPAARTIGHMGTRRNDDERMNEKKNSFIS